MSVRRCSLCLKVKDSSDFRKNRSSKDGLYSRCKACYRESYTHNKGCDVRATGQSQGGCSPELAQKIVNLLTAELPRWGI